MLSLSLSTELEFEDVAGNEDLPATKLVRAEFDVHSSEHFATVFKAFAKPFPSLRGIEPSTIYAWMVDGDTTAAEALSAAIDAASCGGKWPACIRETTVLNIHGSVIETTFEIKPYVGDRYLQCIPQEGWRFCVIADYSARPSAVAAEAIIQLIGCASRFKDTPTIPRLWNEPSWDEPFDGHPKHTNPIWS